MNFTNIESLKFYIDFSFTGILNPFFLMGVIETVLIIKLIIWMLKKIYRLLKKIYRYVRLRF